MAKAIRYNICARTVKRWQVFMYARKYEDGGISLTITRESLKRLNDAIANLELLFNDYDSIDLKMFERASDDEYEKKYKKLQEERRKEKELEAQEERVNHTDSSNDSEIPF